MLRRTWSDIRATLPPLAPTIDAPDPDGSAAAAPVAAPEHPEPLPWFVRVLVGLAAWLAAALLIAFAALAMRLNSEAMRPLGAFMLVGGVLLLRGGRGDFVGQAGLASSLAGQALVVVMTAFADHSSSGGTKAAALALGLSLPLIWLVPRSVHRFCETAIAAAAPAMLLAVTNTPRPLDLAVLPVAGLAGWLWVARPARLERHGVDRWASAAYALIAATFGILLVGLSAGVESFHLSSPELVMGRISGAGLGLGVVVLALALRSEAGGGERVDPLTAAGLAAVTLLGVATPGAPGVVVAVGVMLLGIARREPLLIGLAALFEVLFLGLLYYSLAASLLTKSVLLMGTGAALIAAAAIIHRRGRA